MKIKRNKDIEKHIIEVIKEEFRIKYKINIYSYKHSKESIDWILSKLREDLK